MAWNFLMKNKADTRINKNNTINIIQHNTQAMEALNETIKKINESIIDLEKRVVKLENKVK